MNSDCAEPPPVLCRGVTLKLWPLVSWAPDPSPAAQVCSVQYLGVNCSGLGSKPEHTRGCCAASDAVTQVRVDCLLRKSPCFLACWEKNAETKIRPAGSNFQNSVSKISPVKQWYQLNTITYAVFAGTNALFVFCLAGPSIRASCPFCYLVATLVKCIQCHTVWKKN